MAEQETKIMVKDIHRALVGEPQFNREGLIQKVERHDSWINAANIRIAGIIGGSVVVVFLVPLAVKVIFQ